MAEDGYEYVYISEVQVRSQSVDYAIRINRYGNTDKVLEDAKKIERYIMGPDDEPAGKVVELSEVRNNKKPKP